MYQIAIDIKLKIKNPHPTPNYIRPGESRIPPILQSLNILPAKKHIYIILLPRKNLIYIHFSKVLANLQFSLKIPAL
jgi:hypothetical protein